MDKQAWQCPGCKTWYAPHVEKCECQKDDRAGVGALPYVPYTPYTDPYWYKKAVWPW